MMQLVRRIVLLSGCLLACGCGGGVDRPTVYPVSGTVAYNGKPVAGALVSFFGESAAKEASGITDAEGKFQLSTYGLNDGAVPGMHKVTVSKSDPDAAPPAASMEQMLNDPAAMAQMSEAASSDDAKGKKPLIPTKYASPGSTPLTETVSESGDNVFVIQLTD